MIVSSSECFRSFYPSSSVLILQMSDNGDTRAKLSKIQRSIHFPADDKSGLPYLRKEAAGCTSVIKNDAFDLAVDDRIQAALVEAEQINWCRTIQPVYPVNALGMLNSYAIHSTALQNITDCVIVSVLGCKWKGFRLKSNKRKYCFYSNFYHKGIA